MDNNYTTTVSEIKESNIKFGTAQITLNGRVFPGKRKTREMLTDLLNNYNDKFNKLIVHYDFIYIASRYAMFAQHVKQAIVREVRDIWELSYLYPKLQGIVFHTDYPLAKEFFKAEDRNKFIEDKYKAGIWNVESIKKLAEDPDTIVSTSIVEFLNDVDKYWFSGMCPLFIENTTKVSASCEGTIEGLKKILLSHYQYDCAGLCYDTEHEFAVTGQLPTKEYLKDLNREVPLLVHLNTIPSEVKPKSKKDRHSLTKISDCSQLSANQYEELIQFMNIYWIDWVREVKQETMLEEIEWYKSHQ